MTEVKVERQQPQLLDSKLWNDFGDRLLQKNDVTRQKKFLAACTSRDIFLKYLRSELQTDNFGFDSLIRFDYQFTESEFFSPPEDTQKTIWERFNKFNLSPICMSDECYWGRVMLDLIERGKIEPEWLAANSSNTSEGAQLIDHALKSHKEKEIDTCVRRILRSLCNPRPRGRRVIYSDFPISRSWWRYYWAHWMSDHLELELERILEILESSIYHMLAERMHSGRSFISFPNIIGGLLLFLDKAQEPINTDALRQITNKIAYLIIWKALEMQNPSLVCDEITGFYYTENT